VSLHDCCPGEMDFKLPTRILDLELCDGSKDLRLYEAQDKFGSYATLSHSWGTGPKPFRTKLASLDERLCRIRLHDLPRSFQDAVKICRALGLKHLWIDSLCIIQDSEEDWASESSQMARIYKDCLMMIAFSGYENSHQPILCPRPHVNTCELGDNLKGVFFQSNLRSGLHDDPQSNLGTSPCPLSRRGWAFQERLLAPRTLHYTAEQLIWECTKFSVSESGRWDSRQEYVIPARVNGESKNKYYSLWRQLVQNYTLRDLTYPDDRFPALSGVASEIQKRIDDIYIAGLWRDDLHRGLVWEVHRSGPAAKYRAPSWSWASIDGRVLFKEKGNSHPIESRVNHHHDAMFLSHHIHLTTSDYFGKIDRPITSEGLKLNSDFSAPLPLDRNRSSRIL